MTNAVQVGRKILWIIYRVDLFLPGILLFTDNVNVPWHV